MIQIEEIEIREFRGIRELKITPNCKSFVISGPHGSGKSGIVDAIQFGLTGEVSRLPGKGTVGLSVTRHGPHVDRRDDPAAAEVSLKLYIPETKKSAVLTRNIKNEEVAEHPELILSRREIIKYIIVEGANVQTRFRRF
jgi:DNA repair exonuclease SbcCD ATPase subunit